MTSYSGINRSYVDGTKAVEVIKPVKGTPPVTRFFHRGRNLAGWTKRELYLRPMRLPRWSRVTHRSTLRGAQPLSVKRMPSDAKKPPHRGCASRVRRFGHDSVRRATFLDRE
jgi:hypothetical protein